MTRETLAYYGCAELFQVGNIYWPLIIIRRYQISVSRVFMCSLPVHKDVHTELIQHRRAWMIKRGIVKGNLTLDSLEQHRNGLCPLMPEEVFSILIIKIIEAFEIQLRDFRVSFKRM